MSDIAFEDHKDGQTIWCQSDTVTSGLKRGDTIDIIAQPGTCYIPIIVGGTPSYFIRFAIAFGFVAMISFALSVLSIRYSWRDESNSLREL